MCLTRVGMVDISLRPIGTNPLNAPLNMVVVEFGQMPKVEPEELALCVILRVHFFFVFILGSVICIQE